MAIDRSPRMIADAAARNAAFVAAGVAEFLVASLEEADLGELRFDAILAVLAAAGAGEALGAQAVAVLEDLADRHEQADGDGAGGEPLVAQDLALAAGEMGSGGGHARNLPHPGRVHIGVIP